MKRGIQLCASMLCADPGHLNDDILEINKAGVDLLHVDIMDGHFVPNMTGGSDVADCIREYANEPCDFHLMVRSPENILADLKLREGERAALHIETGADLSSMLKNIRDKGAKAGIAVCPGTPVGRLLPYMDLVDYFLVLIVNPGFKGQPIVKRTLDKTARLKRIIEEGGYNIRLLIDGAVTCENIIEIVEAGADDLVLGPFSCFNKELGGIGPTLRKIKGILLDNGYDCNLQRRGGANL